ncbi:Sir2 family NAD-dependent protein deacetylase [Halogeometricum luteum]|uniref:NAD-dependent protein deacetylase n=1 Tax=Halogeometricum luteum TaxID=2950537 RepID=A0ABU2FZZ8_9EURY|nr:Sir2 family NAD-dependent protein deacetylase [Halogeometricum sp. S3BR5-2]MDS0294116.1 NAD-dependent protein deacetylase [Halogeometricum sp. S3BR5-2]
MDEQVAELAETLVAADGVTVLTGAGASAASGVPTFRGDGGIWGTEFDVESFTIERFERDPRGFWEDRLELHDRMFGDVSGPNEAHRALAWLEELGVVDAVVTQNTDGLHREAGTERLVELHGDASRSVCAACGEAVPTEEALDGVRAGDAPPSCPEYGCEGHLRPDVVLYGEDLSEAAYGSARRLAWESDVLLVVGSSMTVEPAASLPVEAAERGELAVFDAAETVNDGLADYLVRGDAAETLPALVDAVQSRMPGMEEARPTREGTRVR